MRVAGAAGQGLRAQAVHALPAMVPGPVTLRGSVLALCAKWDCKVNWSVLGAALRLRCCLLFPKPHFKSSLTQLKQPA